jgi:hypothetical protein
MIETYLRSKTKVILPKPLPIKEIFMGCGTQPQANFQ